MRSATAYNSRYTDVFNDRKIYNSTDQNYEPVMMSWSDFYAFGMQMPGRNGGVNYRYQFNGMEHDGEVSGNGNSYTTEFRQYDPRLGRWKSLDPLKAKFPWQSPYVAYDNNPVVFRDPLGLAAEGGPGKGRGRTSSGAPKHKGGKDQKEKIGNPNVNKGGMLTNSLEWAKKIATIMNELPDPVDMQNQSDIARLEALSEKHEIYRDKPSWYSSLLFNVGLFIYETDFVVDASAKVSVGVQSKVSGKLGPLDVKADVNLVSFELVSGHVDFTELGSNNPDAYGGDYIGSGSGTKVKQGLELTAGIFGREFLGGKIQRSFKTHGSGSFDEKVDYGVYVLLPVVKSKKSSDINPLKDANLIKSPNVKNSKVGKQEDFYGIDIGAGAAFIIGVDINLKIGFKR